MFSDKVAKSIQELLLGNGFTVYYVDQVPSYDQAKNLDGFVVWDSEEISPMHSTEGVEYAGSRIVLNFWLSITVYDGRMATRNAIETLVLNRLQPLSSGKRIPLRNLALTNSYVRYMVWSNITEFPIPKTAQSNAEMSASVLMFNSSISVSE